MGLHAYQETRSCQGIGKHPHWTRNSTFLPFLLPLHPSRDCLDKDCTRVSVSLGTFKKPHGTHLVTAFPFNLAFPPSRNRRFRKQGRSNNITNVSYRLSHVSKIESISMYQIRICFVFFPSFHHLAATKEGRDRRGKRGDKESVKRESEESYIKRVQKLS